MRNGEVLYRAKDKINILQTIQRKNVNWIGDNLLRNCLLKHIIEGQIEERIEMAGRRGRRRKQLLDDLKEKIGYSHLKEEALDRTVCRNRSGGDFGPVVRQNTE